MKVSVVVPTYNAERFLAACLDGLLHQDCPASSCEVIIVDDGSTDGTPGLLDHYADEFETQGRAFKQVRIEHGGISAARNAGIEVAGGEVVAFTDSDCFADPGWVSAILKHFDEHPEHLGMGGRTVSEPEKNADKKSSITKRREKAI